jgi:hypothetical protein
MGALGRARHPPSQGQGMVSSAGAQAMGEGLQGPPLMARRARSPPGRLSRAE